MKQHYKVKRRFLTLIEMMIVMFIIAMLIGFLAYKYTGTLDESRAFKTKVAIERLTTILSLRAADDPNLLNNLESEWQVVVRGSPLVNNPNDLINDGWGQPFQVGLDNNHTITVFSQKYADYVHDNPQTMFSNQR